MKGWLLLHKVISVGLSLFRMDGNKGRPRSTDLYRLGMAASQDSSWQDRSNDLEQQQNDDDQNDQANTAATVVTNSRPETIATKSEDEKQNNKNDQHTFSFAEVLRVNQQQLMKIHSSARLDVSEASGNARVCKNQPFRRGAILKYLLIQSAMQRRLH